MIGSTLPSLSRALSSLRPTPAPRLPPPGPRLASVDSDSDHGFAHSKAAILSEVSRPGLPMERHSLTHCTCTARAKSRSAGSTRVLLACTAPISAVSNSFTQAHHSLMSDSPCGYPTGQALSRHTRYASAASCSMFAAPASTPMRSTICAVTARLAQTTSRSARWNTCRGMASP